MNYKIFYHSPIGTLTLVSNGTELIGLWMDGQKNPEMQRQQSAAVNDDLPLFSLVCNWLDRYFSCQRPSPQEIPIAPYGTAFRQEVWELLCKIPYGTTCTYAELAREIAMRHNLNSMSAQAVGNAVGKNPISIIIPCHRVIGKNGGLTGYAGGLERKQWLLRHEGAAI